MSDIFLVLCSTVSLMRMSSAYSMVYSFRTSLPPELSPPPLDPILP